ncbi:MAG: hypothetical protein ACM3O4_03885 [Ignavibacteriales bacterium]
MKNFILSILKINNKGLVISGILYATLILFLVLMLGVLSILANSKYLLDKTKNDLVDKLNSEEYYIKTVAVMETPIMKGKLFWVTNSKKKLTQYYFDCQKCNYLFHSDM